MEGAQAAKSSRRHLIQTPLKRFVSAVPPATGQVLFKLVANAIKFTDSGEVVVRARTLSSKGPGLAVQFEVADTGVGLTQEEQSRVFSTYSQVDSSTTRRHGGTGLGLATARMLTQLMGGEIGVEDVLHQRMQERLHLEAGEAARRRRGARTVARHF